MTGEDTPTLDMTEVIKLLDDARGIAEELHGQRINVEGVNNKEVMRAKSRASNQLLYGAHLIDVARVAFTNQYHIFKGQNVPNITA